MRKALGPTLLVAASLAFCAVLLEVGLRVAGVPHREARLSCLDPLIGNVFCAGAEGEVAAPDGGRQPVHINAEGMADREYPRAKPAGTLRIALLGDSVAASLYLPVEAKFGGLWEKALAQRLQRPVEVLNFAIDGTSTWEQVRLYHLRARHFQPDYVVLAFFWGNDVWNNEVARDKSRAPLLQDQYPPRSWRDEFRVAQRNFARWLWNHSRAYQFLRTLQDRAKTLFDYRTAQGRALPVQQGSEARLQPALDPATAWTSGGWELTRSLILRLKQEAERSGARLAVLQLPMLDQLHYPRPLPYAQLRTFLAANSIASLDLFETLERMDANQKAALYLGDRTHLTAAGHALIAQATSAPLHEALRGIAVR